MIPADIQLNELKLFSIINLKRLFNTSHQLFHARECFKSQKIEADLSFRYSIMALLGLYAHQNHPEVRTAFNLKQIHRSLYEKSITCNRLENLGLMLWLDARNGGDFLSQILKLMAQLKPEENYKKLATYELAWLLTGLAYALQNFPALRSTQWATLTQQVFEHLHSRYCRKTGLFFHCAPRNLKTQLRRNISDFADQIYSIYAGATYYQFTAQPAALEMAQQCARRLAELQGPAGEWWWLYHTRSGRVAYRYPVYTVHQDGMAPMAYLKLTEVTREDWMPVIHQSFSWLFESNGVIKYDFSSLKIIRGIRIMPPVLKHLAVALSLCGLGWIAENIFYRAFRWFDIINEYRAYHLGWILYYMGYHEKLNPAQESASKIK